MAAVRPFRFEFALSKLRVRFNKESRYRRLITAEMDQTHLCYSTKKFGGGVRADASVGNLYLIDSAAARGDTLYGRILGLKTDLPGTSSLWRIKYETFPRLMGSVERRAPPSDTELTSVVIDNEKGSIHGCDTSVELAFSPMRFVYLQQLWLEITDYFFEGILGYEVWGKLRPSEEEMEDASRSSRRANVADQQNNPKALHERGDSNQPGQVDGNFIHGSDAAGLSFLRFEITMDSPVLILPVSYRSPHHMRISLGNMTCSNLFSGHLEDESGENRGVADVDVARLRMQWYNNCHVSFEDFSLADWEGTSLCTNRNDETVGMQIHVKWPIGPTAPAIIPKWNVKWTIDPIQFIIRRTDYALFQHFIYYNVGEESRHLDEWNALQDLSQEELQAYKNSIAVHFGYDKKDGPHTTYFIQIECERFAIDLVAPEGSRSSNNAAGVGRISCADLIWSMKKLTDRITKQRLTCGGITLEQLSGETKYSGFRKLLLPLQEVPPEVSDDGQIGAQSLAQRSELVYESTSRPNGDNVKSLWIHDACIYFIYGAFMQIKDFFSNLPDPNVWTRDDIASSMQIGDRWYRIGGGAGGATKGSAAADVVSERRNATEERQYQPLYQFRLVLVSPRIVLVSDPSLSSCQAITLKLSHLDYLYENHQETKTLSRSFFIDGMELFTGLASAPTNANNLSSENSLIHPLCVSLTTVRVESDDTIQNETKIATDVVRARAAYTDLDLAVDVTLALTRDMSSSGTERKDVSDATSGDTTTDDKDSAMMQIPSSEQKVVSGPTDACFSASCAGFDMLVIDDSKRHFANAQKLMELSLGEMKFLRRPYQGADVELVDHFGCDSSLVESMFGLRSLVLLDHLQPQRSRFRCVASSFATNNNEDEIGIGKDRYSMRWKSHAMIVDPSTGWGYRTSPTLLRQCDLDFAGGDPDWLAIRLVTSGDRLKVDCKVNVGAFDVQWNPSTVIAMQRFLGRFKKATKLKVASISRMVSQKTNIQKEQDLVERPARPVTDLRLRLDVESISLCLNKEHQDRRLVKTSIVFIQVTLCRDRYKSSEIQGIIGDISAWDTDLVVPIHESNRQILAVAKKAKRAATEDRFLSFHYRSFKQRENRRALLDQRLDLPQWVRSSIKGETAEDDDIDYFLNVEFASLRMIHLRDRTEEILDYLSNGLPVSGCMLARCRCYY